MNGNHFFSDNFRWEWRTPLLIAICLIPSILLCLFLSPEAGVGAVLGLIPAAFQGVAPLRKRRFSVLVLGVLISVSMLLGTLLKMYAGMWLSALAIALLALGSVRLTTKYPATFLISVMCVPVVGIGFSYSALRVPVEVFALMLTTSFLAWLVSLAFPEYTPSPEHRTISPQHGVVKPPPPEHRFAPKTFGYLYGAAMATSTLIGFHLDHTGWVVGSTGFVMRPSDKLERFRSVWRMLSVLGGAALASLFLLLQPGGLLTVLLAGLAMVIAGGLRQSRAYVMPAFMTFIVFLVILYPVQDSGAIWMRFLERVGWVGVGILVAAFYEMVLPGLYERIKKPSQ